MKMRMSEGNIRESEVSVNYMCSTACEYECVHGVCMRVCAYEDTGCAFSFA